MLMLPSKWEYIGIYMKFFKFFFLVTNFHNKSQIKKIFGNMVEWEPLVVWVQSQWANGNHCSISLISLVDIRPLKMCHIIYSPLIVIEYTHWKCTGRTLKEDWVQEDLLTLFLALPWFFLLIFLVEINFNLILPSYPNKSFGKKD